jgi:glycerate kinase
MGKLPMGILEQSQGVPVCLIAGRISDSGELLDAGFHKVECINPEGISLDDAMRKDVASRNISNKVASLLK